MPARRQQRVTDQHHFVRTFSLLLLALITLAGCWPLPQDNADTTVTPVATVSPVSQGGGGPTTVGAVNISLAAGDPPTLDPALATDPYSLSVIRQLFSALVTYDSGLNVVPDVAASLPQVSADGKTYTFTLRRGVRFTNGQEVTSADFKYSFERAADPRLAGPFAASALPAALYLSDIVGMKEKLAGIAKDIAGVVAPDPYTLVLTIDTPKSYFLAKLAAGPDFVVQRSNVESGEAWTEEPHGTGPYKLQKWESNNYMTLARNTDYFGGAPEVTIVNLLMGHDRSQVINRYSSDTRSDHDSPQLDVVTVPLDDLETVLDRNNPLSRELRVTASVPVTYLGFNTRQKPFDDPKIREAVARALDIQGITRTLFQSRLQEAEGLILPGMAGYKPVRSEQVFNVTRASQLIAESSYKELKNLPRLRLTVSGNGVGPLISEALSQTLGLGIEVQDVPWSDYQAGLARGDYSMFLTETSASYADPDASLAQLFTSSSPGNVTGYQNTDVDTLLTAAASEGDTGKRQSSYAVVEGQVLSEYVVLPLYRAVSYTLVKPIMRGVALTPFGLLSLRDMKVVGR